MTATFEDQKVKILEKLETLDPSTEEAQNLIKTLKLLGDSHVLFKPDPIPEPEPTGVKAFFARNSGDLIKVGGTLLAIGAIGFIEGKDLILRSKATKYI